MDLVNGLFRVNGNCGYVLKPEVLRNGLGRRLFTIVSPSAINSVSVVVDTTCLRVSCVTYYEVQRIRVFLFRSAFSGSDQGH